MGLISGKDVSDNLKVEMGDVQTIQRNALEDYSRLYLSGMELVGNRFDSLHDPRYGDKGYFARRGSAKRPQQGYVLRRGPDVVKFTFENLRNRMLY